MVADARCSQLVVGISSCVTKENAQMLLVVV